MKPPAFQFYAGDFIAGTITLTHAERGLYILALCLQWDQGAVDPTDLKHLAGDVPTERVFLKFDLGSDGLLRNYRLETERQKQADYRAEQSRKGIASALARFNRGSTVVQPDGQPNTQPNTQPKPNSPSPSPSPASNSNGEGKVASLPRTQKPSIEAVKLQSAKIGLSDFEAEKFFNYYESNGWRVGKNPMKSWVHALSNWKKNVKIYRTSQNGQKPNPRNAGVVGDLAENARRTAEIIRQRQAEKANQPVPNTVATQMDRT